MRASPLVVERIEFVNIRVKPNMDWRNEAVPTLPQITFDLEDANVDWKSDLDYPDTDAENPRFFVFRFAIRLIQTNQKKNVKLPYDVEVEAVVFLALNFSSDPSPSKRFEIVRDNGYPILFGAIREMVCNLTARCRHGVWQIPSMNFRDQIAEEAARDEVERLARVKALTKKAKSKPKKVS